MARRKPKSDTESEAKSQDLLGATLWSLAQEGQTVKQIADRYGMHRGDVRLAIAKAKAKATHDLGEGTSHVREWKQDDDDAE
jgi:hypothetical protein